MNATPASSRAETEKAKQHLVHRFAFELLREKSPPLYDALPWYDWDFSIVTRRFRLWRTRLLLYGEGMSVTLAGCRRTAGVCVLEPLEATARYIESKGRLENVKRLRVIRTTLEQIPLKPGSVDLALVGPSLGKNPEPALAELERVARNILLLCLRPGAESPDDNRLRNHGFIPDQVRSGRTGATRPCWWRLSDSLD